MEASHFGILRLQSADTGKGTRPGGELETLHTACVGIRDVDATIREISLHAACRYAAVTGDRAGLRILPILSACQSAMGNQ